MCAAVRAVTEAALDGGIRNAMKDIQGEEAWTSWVQLISEAWAADVRVQKGWITACIAQARLAVAQGAAKDSVTSEAENDLLNSLDHWDRHVTAAAAAVCPLNTISRQAFVG